MAQLSRRTRILLTVGLAGAAGVVTLGGVAYAVSGTGDSSGDSAYVQIEGSDATSTDTTPETTPETTPDNGTEGNQPRGDRDCPEKDGQGGGQGGTETPAQPESPNSSNAAGRA